MKCVVTGGSGFVGSSLARRLARDGHQVTTIQRGTISIDDDGSILRVKADIGVDREVLSNAFRGADVVFHTAAMVGMWGRYSDFYQTNVVGTLNVIQACRDARVPFLVFTSSPSVVANGENLRGVDEAQPYPTSFEAFYPETKALAEQAVLQANSHGDLKTVVLRPHIIFGPGDTHIIPMILERARSGSLRVIGDGANLSDVCFIDDCVEAHLLACKALQAGKPVDGHAYFITQGEPVSLWEFINEIAERGGAPKVTKRIGFKKALRVAGGLEFFSRLFPFLGPPRLTRFLVSEMGTDHYFSIDRARRELGYTPHCSVQQALDATFCKELKDVAVG